MTLVLPRQASDVNLSTFDLLESLSQNFQTVVQAITPLLHFAGSPFSPVVGETQNSTSLYAGASFAYNREILTKDQLFEKVEKVEDLIKKLANVDFPEHPSQTEQDMKKEISDLKESLFISKQFEIDLRVQCEQLRVQSQVQEDSLMQRITVLEKEIEDYKANFQEQLERLNEALRDEKRVKKRMEQWFQRRLEAIEYYMNDLEAHPQDEKRMSHLVAKIKRLKTKKPWIQEKNLKLVLDEALLNQKRENDGARSSGTSTPFSHYACFFSSAASDDNTINQAFIGSEDSSFTISQNSFLDESESQALEKPEKNELESFARKMRDEKLSLTEKEKIFCMYVGNNDDDENLLHVDLKDILNAGNADASVHGNTVISIGKDSLSLDLIPADIKQDPKLGHDSRGFNHKVRLDEIIRDAELEEAVSSIAIESNQKVSSPMDSFKKSSRFLEDKVFDSDFKKKGSKGKLDKEEGDEGKDSDFAKILSGISISEQDVSHDAHQRNAQKPLGLQQEKKKGRMLLGDELAFKSKRIKSEKSEDMDLNSIDNKRIDISGKFSDKLDVSDSFLIDEFKDLLEKVNNTEDADVSQKQQFRPSGKSKDEKLQPQDGAIASKKSLGQGKVLAKEEVADLLSDHKFLGDILESINNISTRKSQVLQVDRFQSNHSSSFHGEADSNILDIKPIDSNFSKSRAEEKLDENLSDKGYRIEKVEKVMDKDYGSSKTHDDRPPLQPVIILKTPPKITVKHIDENQSTHNNFKKVYPRPRPPAIPRRSMDFRNNSLFDDYKAEGQNNSFENLKQGDKQSSPQLGLTFQNVVDTMSINIESPDNYFKSDNIAAEFKNNRNVRSLTVESRSLNKVQTQLQTLITGNAGSIYLKRLDVSPPRKKGSHSPFIRSFSIYNNLTQSPYGIKHPQSSLPKFQGGVYKDTFADIQVDPFSAGTDYMAVNKILPYEKSRIYPAPNLNGNQQFHRKVHGDNIASATYKNQGGASSEDSNSEKIYKTSHQEIRPISPPKRGRLSNQRFQSGPLVLINDGSAQFRAKKFAARKV